MTHQCNCLDRQHFRFIWTTGSIPSHLWILNQTCRNQLYKRIDSLSRNFRWHSSVVSSARCCLCQGPGYGRREDDRRAREAHTRRTQTGARRIGTSSVGASAPHHPQVFRWRRQQQVTVFLSGRFVGRITCGWYWYCCMKPRHFMFNCATGFVSHYKLKVAWRMLLMCWCEGGRYRIKKRLDLNGILISKYFKILQLFDPGKQNAMSESD